MPRIKKTWSSWNFLGSSSGPAAGDGAAVCVTYWLNKLQNLPPGTPQLFVTLNPLAPPAEDKVIKRLSLAHPAFSSASYRAQERVPAIQGTGSVYFAGGRAARVPCQASGMNHASQPAEQAIALGTAARRPFGLSLNKYAARRRLVRLRLPRGWHQGRRCRRQAAGR